MKNKAEKINRAMEVISEANLRAAGYFTFTVGLDEGGKYSEGWSTDCACAIGSLVVALDDELSNKIIPYLTENNTQFIKTMYQEAEPVKLLLEAMGHHYGLDQGDIYQVQLANDRLYRLKVPPSEEYGIRESVLNMLEEIRDRG